MKRALIGLIMLSLPLLCEAKYCPACLNTFQVHTSRGLAHTVYHWLDQVMLGKKRLTHKDMHLLFNPNATVTINGVRVAENRQAAFQVIQKLHKSHRLYESQLQQVIVEKNHVAMKYEWVSSFNHQKYRYLSITLLHVQHLKVTSWWEITYRNKL